MLEEGQQALNDNDYAEQMAARAGRANETVHKLSDAVDTGQNIARAVEGDPIATIDLAGKYGPKIAQYASLTFIFLFSLLLFFFYWSGTPGTPDAADAATVGSVTTAKLPTDIINQINANLSVYKAAAAKEGVSWQIIAAIHYREGSLDPNRSDPSGMPLGSVNPDSGKVECSTFQECAASIASHARSMAKMVYGVALGTSNTDEQLKQAFVSYNRGFMYKSHGCTVDQSPYAMNQFDDAHKNMRWPDSACEPSSTRGKINVPYGAFTIYSYLVSNKIGG